MEQHSKNELKIARLFEELNPPMGGEGSRPQILFVDAYDSFAQNIVVLVRDSLNAHVTFTTIDDLQFVDATDDELRRILKNWHGIIIGPGPGHPQKPVDVGWVQRLWHLQEVEITPVLGICLGFQSLCAAFGAEIERLREPKHGIVGPIFVKGNSILAFDQNDTSYDVTHYHSLTVRLGGVRSTTLPWAPSPNCGDIEPLAWDVSDKTNGLILQAVRHRRKPFWGVQYHPESICSEHGSLLIRNWWNQICSWRDANGMASDLPLPKMNVLGRENRRSAQHHSALSSGTAVLTKDTGSPTMTCPEVAFVTIEPAHHLSCKAICEAMGLSDGEVIVLESGTSAQGAMMHPHTGRYTIIGLVDDQTSILEYHLISGKMVIRSRRGISNELEVVDPWRFFSEWTTSMRPQKGGPDVPFWGGLMGFASYEAGLHTRLGLKVNSQSSGGRERPDILFASIKRSIVIDHKSSKVHIQSILAPSELEQEWCMQVRQRLLDAQTMSSSHTTPSESPTSHSSSTTNVDDPRKTSCVGMATRVAIISKPSKVTYFKNLRACDEQIRAGNSYELCLTDRTRICISHNRASSRHSWGFYQSLVRRNAAPFSAYVRLSTANNGITIVSSSPERFLSWNRDGLCEYRPIKGTVKKGSDMTLEKAKQILGTSKERAENLMIADLVRHDLNSVSGIKDVRVPGLFRVEEYATVYQLVSVIQGDLPVQTSEITDDSRALVSTGIDVLVQSLPPGSMTGAPKLRSCQILQELEKEPRGIYSGVLGYLDCGGGGDFSVVIRTAFSWNDEDEPLAEGGVSKLWTVGAGGAVTAQSTLQGEWDEMVAKADTVLSVLGAVLE